jgi:ribosomal protein L11 methyltransferase
LKTWPALDIQPGAQSDLVLALVDDFRPTALEERGAGVRVFFATSADRDHAAGALQPQFHVSPINVPDDDWARRSQENLTPITVGRITVVPPWHATDHRSLATDTRPPITDHRPPITIVIVPSMGFGTGHHATTRLCLAALQRIDLNRAHVLDVGTGSGVLAIAAVLLGATRALGLDDDPDAIQSANENLALNPPPHPSQTVTFTVADLMTLELPAADVVTANLTGALLIRAAGRLRQAVRLGGVLIVSGLLVGERDDVLRAFSDLKDESLVISEAEEDGWITFAFGDQKSSRAQISH